MREKGVEQKVDTHLYKQHIHYATYLPKRRREEKRTLRIVMDVAIISEISLIQLREASASIVVVFDSNIRAHTDPYCYYFCQRGWIGQKEEGKRVDAGVLVDREVDAKNMLGWGVVSWIWKFWA